MCSHESKGMIILVLLREWIAILPVYVHEDRFNDNSSMGMIENLLNILGSSDSDNLFSLSEIVPFVLEFVLECA